MLTGRYNEDRNPRWGTAGTHVPVARYERHDKRQRFPSTQTIAVHHTDLHAAALLRADSDDGCDA